MSESPKKNKSAYCAEATVGEGLIDKLTNINSPSQDFLPCEGAFDPLTGLFSEFDHYSYYFNLFVDYLAPPYVV